MKKGMSRFAWGAVSLAVFALLGGCAAPGRNHLGDVTQMPQPNLATPVNTVGNEDGNVIDLDTEFEDAFVYRPVHLGQRLPDKNIKTMSLTDTAILDALRLLLRDTPVSLSMANATNSNSIINGTVTAYNLSGNLPDVVEKLSNSAGFFYKYTDGTLNIYPDEQFVVTLPPIINEDVFAGMANTIQKLGATDTYLDRYGRTLSFRANRVSMRAIDGFLENIRATRSIIVFDCYVYQVDLLDGSQTGIKWNNLAIAIGPGGALGTLGAAGGSSVASSGGMGFSAIYKGSRLSLDALFSFLQTQGNVKTVAQPKMAIISGSKGFFKVGSTTKYVSEVGTNSSTTVNQVTVKTDTVMSGLDLSLTGDVSDGTVYARIKLSLSELIRFNSFEALGTKLQLPQTTTRELTTAIRSRPGDVVLLGGVNNSREDSDYSGLPGNAGAMMAATSVTKNTSRSELVMVLKPKIVRFNTRKSESPRLGVAPVEGNQRVLAASADPFVPPAKNDQSRSIAIETANAASTGIAKAENAAAVAKIEQEAALAKAQQDAALAKVAQGAALIKAEQALSLAQTEKATASAKAEQEADQSRAALEKAEQNLALARVEKATATVKAGLSVTGSVMKYGTNNIPSPKLHAGDGVGVVNSSSTSNSHVIVVPTVSQSRVEQGAAMATAQQVAISNRVDSNDSLSKGEQLLNSTKVIASPSQSNTDGPIVLQVKSGDQVVAEVNFKQEQPETKDNE